VRDGELEKVRLGISTCLLGEHVRYDGGHKRDPFLADTLGRFVEWVPVCPEVEIGLGVPRPAIRLTGRADTPRLVLERSGEDLTERMRRFSAQRAADLARLGLDGYVLKRASPSCGLFGVRVYGGDGQPGRVGRGLYAEALVRRFPDLPMEEEGRLRDLPSARTSSSASSQPPAGGSSRHAARVPVIWSPSTPPRSLPCSPTAPATTSVSVAWWRPLAAP
jgi:uncharacterized protein YbbK (DUF523 family)